MYNEDIQQILNIKKGLQNMSKELLNFGIVGAGGRRTKVFMNTFRKSGRARLAAVCDINCEALEEDTKGIPDVLKYTDYEEMLEKADLDAVIVCTPIHLHAQQSIAALERNINVFSEVTAAISIEECMQLVQACKNSKAQYMLGENCNYMRSNMIVRNMVKDGVLGELFYAEGEYNHDCRELISKTPWRKKWLYDVPGITYGTHSLGPILSWLENDRVVSVCCAGSNNATSDLEGNSLTQSTCYIMLCKTEKGRLIKIKNNLASPRPYGLNYVLEGSKGAFSSFRLEGQENKYDYIWLDGVSDKNRWDNITEREEKYLPELWQKHSSENNKIGHTGADIITLIDYIDALYEGRKVPIDIHAAMDMTLPGLISQQSAEKGGVWLPVPDSRNW